MPFYKSILSGESGAKGIAFHSRRNSVKLESGHSPVSYLPPPFRKPPSRTLRDWEAPPELTNRKFNLVEWQATYLVLRLVTSKNGHLYYQEPLEGKAIESQPVAFERMHD